MILITFMMMVRLTMVMLTMFMLTMFRFLKVMFSGFAALLWAAAILCFVATAIQADKEGDEMVN